MNNKENLKIGVLALQGAFAEHVEILQKLKINVSEVRLPEHLTGLNGLIIPGGESTVISKLIGEWDLFDPIRNQAAAGMGVWGTCAGMIMLAKNVTDGSVKTLELMDITVERNAFGRQIDSFTTELVFPAIGKQAFTAVFIRAPIIKKIGSEVEPLIKLFDGTIVAAQQGKFLATSFHPELTADYRFHEYFLKLLA
jgi:pyridoxal 5'-phosphate synthase pdxT subunit